MAERRQRRIAKSVEAVRQHMWDETAGLFLAVGVVGALYKRLQGGGAVKVDVAMLDCQVAMLEGALSAYLCNGQIAQPHA